MDTQDGKEPFLRSPIGL